ncbi:pilus assembly protein PilM [Phycisphaera mikurensis]|uniref:Type IV pilus assembly protein PilM n=1 Tax=Phycisphaera mikurensis (strain NBRC 102666 / KCTC 22515 / FYK2301M01) TaxID=1142394 RepID=I0IHW2_PHYMF|nr:pilus assembly protein PilM [Phycisphaera mikurensis]MBB6441091.1 Tfp pilus assembly PilM family ATPase [Phycisphaera mikurensis]BAM04850.1 hypothetical protein PSMK_26910 [Phycisphaera mikurensis NBRC 102666]
MAFGLSSKNRTSPIAVDFGSDTLKVLQIDSSERTEIIAAGSAVLSDDARTNPAARMAFLEESLKKILRGLPFRGRRAMLAIPGYQTLIHNFTMDRCDDEDIDAMVDLQLQERLGVQAARMVTRNTKTADHHRGGSEKTDVSCLAAKRDLVMSYLQLAGRCRLEVVGMHPEPIALIRALSDRDAGVPAAAVDDRSVALRGTRSGPSPARLVLDFAHATSRVLILEGETLRLARTIHAGGLHLTRQRTRESGESFLAARTKRRAEAAAEPGDTPLSCRVAELLIEELRMTLRHHHARHPASPVTRVLVCGGEAASEPRLRALGAALSLPVSRFDPLAGAAAGPGPSALSGVDLAAGTGGWAVPWGLCHSELNL